MITELKNSNKKITMLADGFIDEVWEVVASRADNKNYTLYTEMGQFAQRILSSGTGGVGMELLRKRRAFGGFTANIGYAAARLGVTTNLVGVFGKDALDPIFNEVDALCNMYSIGDAATTHVFEFDNGKMLMSHMEAVLDITWQDIVQSVGIDKLRTMLVDSDMLGVGYWSLLPAFDEIFDNVCAMLPDDGKLRRFFFDFADFRKKDEASLKFSLEKLRVRNQINPMILSVNEHEGAALFAMFNETLDGASDSISAKTERVRVHLGLDELVIHSPHFAVAASSGATPVYADCEYCEKPIRTAGAGDAFNGGYIAATLAGLDLAACVSVGNAAVWYFIRNAIYPEISDLPI